MRGEFDQRVRLAAFQWLRAQMDVHGEVLPRSILAQGFMFDGRRVPLLGPQGIFSGRCARCRSRSRPRRAARTPAHGRRIEAYRTRCAFCRLRHQDLLDAAHITADAAETGEPVVSKGMHGASIYVPREATLQPERVRLEQRYAAFVEAGS